MGTAIVHLGGVRFPVSGPLRYTMTGAEAVELCGLLEAGDGDPGALRGLEALPRGAGRGGEAFAAGGGPAPTWLEIGTPATIEV